MPEYYETTHGRKVVEDSRNIIDLVKQPNKFSAMIAGVCLIFVVIIVLVVFLIRRMIRRIRVRKEKFEINIWLYRKLSLKRLIDRKVAAFICGSVTVQLTSE